MHLTRGLEDHCLADTCLSTAKCPTARMFHHQNILRAPDKKVCMGKAHEGRPANLILASITF